MADPKKSTIGVQELKYLEYLVVQGHIKPQPIKVEALQAIDQPVTKRQLQQFLGLMGYYSKFIQAFASKAAPLADFLWGKEPNKLRWTEEAQQAFIGLRAALSDSMVL
ncbi:uncharacterized protein LOC128322421 [Hemicordylus capensis]|uniref:uncharacterized protein LOC128322421 n=1 Tax=Hemicordylus capensis TaxID=884348 RepID=UPI002302BE1C|nr:uncharacterized protein LOC128322421 [Hemicordylus capensis]